MPKVIFPGRPNRHRCVFKRERGIADIVGGDFVLRESETERGPERSRRINKQGS